MSKRMSESEVFSSGTKKLKSNNDVNLNVGDVETTLQLELSSQNPNQKMPCPECSITLSISATGIQVCQKDAEEEAQEEEEEGNDDISSLSPVVQNDTAKKSPYYLECFEYIVDTVLKYKDSIPLTIDAFRNLSLDSQKLYVRLYMRKPAWLKVCKLEYNEIGDIHSAIDELIKAGFIINDNELVEPEEILNLLQIPELQELAKKFKIKNVSQSGANLVKALLKSGRQRSVYGEPVMTEIHRSAKQILSARIKLKLETKNMVDDLMKHFTGKDVDRYVLSNAEFSYEGSADEEYDTDEDDDDSYFNRYHPLTALILASNKENIERKAVQIRLDSRPKCDDADDSMRSSTQPTIPVMFSTERSVQQLRCPKCGAAICISVMLNKKDQLSQQWQQEAEEGIGSPVKKKPETGRGKTPRGGRPWGQTPPERIQGSKITNYFKSTKQ